MVDTGQHREQMKIFRGKYDSWVSHPSIKYERPDTQKFMKSRLSFP